MANNKVKVVGYAQRVFYDNGIEYRNFSSDLVGNQSTSRGGATLFTSGNFNVTSTIDRKISKIFLTKKYTPFMCLDDLRLTTQEAATINNITGEVKLNLDKSNLSNYAYFGSLVDYMRVGLENIIIKWPASLYVRPISEDLPTTGYTAENYVYNPVTNQAIYSVDIDRLTNRYNINHKVSGTILNTFNETNDTRNLTVNYGNYVVVTDDGEYPIIDFTGNTNDTNDVIWVTVKGNPFTASTVSVLNYHIRPNTQKVEEFFTNLPDFESNLLNRFTTPKYKSKYQFDVENDKGSIYKTEREVIWPVTDGYNIDFDTTNYVSFVTQLIGIGEANDKTKSNLMVRFLVSDSISDFDTLPNCDGEELETAGQKMNKTLKIYGREFDEVKRFISGIQFANTVTYNKKDNTPDIYLKNLARVFGWELVSSIQENDLLTAYLNPADTSFSGHSRGYTAHEAEIELWRRIILNTPWIWKSKGTRKVVEFFFNFIGTPTGLVSFNEYIYKAKEPVNMDQFRQILLETFGDNSIGGLNVDTNGYPLTLADTKGMYFQKAGLWYRQTGGPDSNLDILEGNNPHVGPYDGGQAYIDQFGCLIDGFSPVTLYNEVITTSNTNIFTNYNSGLINNALESEIYVDIVNSDNISLSACYELTSEFITDPFPTTEVTDCGCETGEDDDSIRLSIKKIDADLTTSPTPIECGYTGFTLNGGGYVVFQLPTGKEALTTSQECCESLGFTYQSTSPSCYWNDTTTLEVDLCNGFEPTSIDATSGYVLWTNTTASINTTVVNKGCCEAYGYDYAIVDGGHSCIDNLNNPCGDWVIQQASDIGLITWVDKGGTTTTNISPECCTSLGYTSVSGKDGYECYTASQVVDGTLGDAPLGGTKI